MGSKWRLEDGHRERAPGAQPPPSAAAWSGPRGEALLLPTLSLSLAGPGWTRKTLEVPGQPGFDSQIGPAGEGRTGRDAGEGGASVP